MENQKGNLDNPLERGEKYSFKLYITGSAQRSVRAVNQINEICRNYFYDYDLQVIDIYENPVLAREDQIIAIPTLIRVSPPPHKRIIGDMADTKKVLAAIGIFDTVN